MKSTRCGPENGPENAGGNSVAPLKITGGKTTGGKRNAGGKTTGGKFVVQHKISGGKPVALVEKPWGVDKRKSIGNFYYQCF